MIKNFSAALFENPARFVSILILTVLSACIPVRSETFSTITPITEMPSTQDEPSLTQPPRELGGGRTMEAILISFPGPNSKAISPMTIEGVADPSLGDELSVSLFELNPSGGASLERIVAKETVDINPQTGSGGPFKVTLSFPVNDPKNFSWVLVSITDPDNGGLVHLTNLPLTLLASGQAEFTQSMRMEEVIQIDSPQPQQIIEGSRLEVSGYSEYFFESNLGVMLCLTQQVYTSTVNQFCGSVKQILSTGNAMIAAPEMGQPGPFKGIISYQVEEETPARLIVFAVSPRDSSILHLSSVEVILQP